MNRLLGDALAELELNSAERRELRSDEASTETSDKRSQAEKNETGQADETHKTELQGLNLLLEMLTDQLLVKIGDAAANP